MCLFPLVGTPSLHKVEPEEVKPLGQLRDPRLVAIDDQVHPSAQSLQTPAAPARHCAADQDGIIGIAMQRGPERLGIPPPMPDLIQQVQVDVAIQR